MGDESEIEALEAEYAALQRDSGRMIGTDANEHHTKRMREIQHRIGNARLAAQTSRGQMSEAELRDRLRPPPPPPEPPIELDAYGRPIVPPPPPARTARAQYESLKATNPLQAAKFNDRYAAEIWGK
jgi:hypothetical protein